MMKKPVPDADDHAKLCGIGLPVKIRAFSRLNPSSLLALVS